MIKKNPEITEGTERELIQLQQDFEACREISTLKDNPGWARVRAIIEANLGKLAEQRKEFQKINDEGVRFILKEEQDFEYFLDLVDGVSDTMQELTARISTLKNSLHERKRHTVTPGQSAGV